MAQLINITSEALQATIRRLLPSQQGFGEDLQATNVVTPIIDLTPTAEGSILPRDLGNALAFGSQTAFSVVNTSSTVINSTGFFRIYGVSSINGSASGVRTNTIQMSDGLSTKDVWKHGTRNSGSFGSQGILVDLIVFCAAGESVTVVSNSTDTLFAGSTRQVADVNGNLVNPSRFTSE